MREWLWRLRFALRIWLHWGAPWSMARDAAWAGDYDPIYTPEEAADDEVSYWADDGDG